MGTDRVQESKGAVTNGRFRNVKGQFTEGNPGKPEGAICLKTRIINDFLASYYDKKVDGAKLLRGLPKQGNWGIKQYLDHIVTLIKGNGDKHAGPAIEINITTAEAEVKKTANDRLSQVLGVDRN